MCVPDVIGALAVWRQNNNQKKKYKIHDLSGVCWSLMLFVYRCVTVNVLFYFSLVCLHVCVYAFKSKVHCGSAFEPGASGLPCYCTPLVCVPDVNGGLAVWRHNNKTQTKTQIRVLNPGLLVSLHSLLLCIRESRSCLILLDMALQCVSTCMFLFSLPRPLGS